MPGKKLAQSSVASALLERVRLQQYSERTLGARSWWLLSMYGRVTAGPHTGHYVSGMPSGEVRNVVDLLAQGALLHIHLMHTHRSGNYRLSKLRFDGVQLWMVYDDKEVLA